MNSRNQPKDPLIASAVLGSRASSYSDTEAQRREVACPGAPSCCVAAGHQSQVPSLVPIASLGVLTPAQPTSSKPPSSTIPFPWVPPTLLCCSQLLSFKENPSLAALAQKGPPRMSSRRWEAALGHIVNGQIWEKADSTKVKNFLYCRTHQCL